MKNLNSLTDDIPVGDIKLIDNYLPSIDAGNYYITVRQPVYNDHQQLDTDGVDTVQEFTVTAPQYFIDKAQVVSMYPVPGSSGKYSEVLPNIVLKDAGLPWERAMDKPTTPWLALMVFQETELNEGDDTGDKSTTTTVAAFQQGQSGVLMPKITREDDIDPKSSCKTISMSAAVFQAIAPGLDELPYLSHIRRINTDNCAIGGINEHGLFSVVAANRFCLSPAGQQTQLKNIVHLVSLEGMEEYLHPKVDLSSYSSVVLLSLASWTFQSQADGYSFRMLAENLVAREKSGNNVDPSLLWLRLPVPTDTNTNVNTVVRQRVADGYLPLPWQTRSGESTFAWYRGPLTPLLPTPSNTHYPTADAALIFDKTHGIFDVTLAAAWETGREIALADAAFLRKVTDFRQQLNLIADKLMHRATSPHFASQAIADTDPYSTVQERLKSLLTPQLIKDMGDTATKLPGTRTTVTRTKKAAPDPQQQLSNFLGRKDVQERLQQLAADISGALSDWMAKVKLLYPIPFRKLIADERLLPNESLRFFYVDLNWLNAAIDGAMSFGITSSKNQLLHDIVMPEIRAAARQKAGRIRSQLTGKQIADTQPADVMSGFLLRSDMVKAWPTLVIRARDANDNSLNIIRTDHLAPNLLLCIFNGVPNNVTLSEPAETLCFGVDDEGYAVIRNTVSGDTALGQQLGTVRVRDLSGKQQYCMRSPESHVLNIAPEDANGLVQTLQRSMTSLKTPPPNGQLTAGTLALQMMKSAEAVVFQSQP
ncbi:hypothetical protein SAMN04488128_106403 [Chitinophaga eiseniae]|uniref:Uncharacterized protein n=1 Tax=Chitinophaga eiseniae TaxID=634771 RepID=A0A1T4TVH6_9BACT|nr:hypothetical protein [Chitinophaga eiseniae]SKA44443.1 hypothetical protein SAMN04488128_106403 [Chitinophaga eiseniae]